jgi:hypothetical protein
VPSCKLTHYLNVEFSRACRILSFTSGFGPVNSIGSFGYRF